MKSHNLELALSDKAIARGGLNLYRHADAVHLVKLCKQHNVRILGVDAFVISDGCTRPVMEHSIDFSSQKIQDTEDVYEFLEARKDLDFAFEIIY